MSVRLRARPRRTASPVFPLSPVPAGKRRPLRHSLVWAGSRLGGLIAAAGLATMFGAAGGHGGGLYLIDPGSSITNDGGSRGLLGVLITTLVLGAGAGVLAAGVFRSPRSTGSADAAWRR